MDPRLLPTNTGSSWGTLPVTIFSMLLADDARVWIAIEYGVTPEFRLGTTICGAWRLHKQALRRAWACSGVLTLCGRAGWLPVQATGHTELHKEHSNVLSKALIARASLLTLLPSWPEKALIQRRLATNSYLREPPGTDGRSLPAHASYGMM